MTATLHSAEVVAVLERIHAVGEAEDEPAKQRVREHEQRSGERVGGAERMLLYGGASLAVAPEVGELLYLLVRAARPKLVVEFGASLGYSTIHLASALRDAGAGLLVSTEMSAEKAREAAASLQDAGLADLVDLRIGDALDTLTDLQGVDMLFLDGWNDL